MITKTTEEKNSWNHFQSNIFQLMKKNIIQSEINQFEHVKVAGDLITVHTYSKQNVVICWCRN